MTNPYVTLAQHRHLTTERLLLRPMQLSDLQDYHAYTSNDDLLKYDYPAHKNLEESLEAMVLWNLRTPLGRYAIEHKATGRMIGNASLRLDESHTTCDIGYTLHPDFHNQGLATEAGLALKKLLKSMPQVLHLKGTVDARNLASQRVLEKLGLSLETKKLNQTNSRGETVTQLIYHLDLYKL